MPTPKQIAARRRNARLSKGPITEAGRAAVAQNALTFGFFARNPVTPGENREEYATFRMDLLASIAPANEKEAMYANRIIEAAWRLRRFPVVESIVFSQGMLADEAEILQAKAQVLVDGDPWEIDADEASDPEECKRLTALAAQAREAAVHPDYAIGRAFIRDAKGHASFALLARYESSIERAMFRNWKALEALQAKRNRKVARIAPGRAQEKLRNSLTEALTSTELAA